MQKRALQLNENVPLCLQKGEEMTVQFQKVSTSENDVRLDRWFKRHFPSVSHGIIEKLLRKKNIRVNGLKATSNQRLRTGDEIRIPPMEVSSSAPKTVKTLSKADIQFVQSLVLYKDSEIIVLNKPAGLAVQGGTKTTRHIDGLLDGLCFDCDERPKLVHRLDKETSGVLMVARTIQSAAKYTKLFKTKEIQKIYWTLVAGCPKIKEGKIDAPLMKKSSITGEKMAVDFDQGDKAISLYQVVDHLANKISWMQMAPLTGRTHQLRVHCAEVLKTPILGDDKYGRRGTLMQNIPHQMYLHAHSITWENENGKMQTVSAPLPDYFRTAFHEFGFDEKQPIDTLFINRRKKC